MNIQVGKKYLVKSWEQMEKEYGLTYSGQINTPCVFVRQMKKYCGNIVTISSKIYGLYSIKEDNGIWNWDDCMFVAPEKTIRYFLEKEGKIYG